MSSSSSLPYPNALEDRVRFKLNAAKVHLDNLKRLEARYGSLASSNVRIRAEMET